jgi:hypothetical protein
MSLSQEVSAKPRGQSKAAPSPKRLSSDDPAGALTWKTVRIATECYWPGLGAPVVDQITEWNDKLLGGESPPMPVVLSRMGKANGHWSPLSGSQARSHEPEQVNRTIHSDPKRLLKVSRATLLRGLMTHYLRSKGLDHGEYGSEHWCALVMRCHYGLTGKRIWCSPQRSRIMEDFGTGNVARRHLEVTQARGPKGEESLPIAVIKSWPMGSIELGTIEREQSA